MANTQFVISKNVFKLLFHIKYVVVCCLVKFFGTLSTFLHVFWFCARFDYVFLISSGNCEVDFESPVTKWDKRNVVFYHHFLFYCPSVKFCFIALVNRFFFCFSAFVYVGAENKKEFFFKRQKGMTFCDSHFCTKVDVYLLSSLKAGFSIVS